MFMTAAACISTMQNLDPENSFTIYPLRVKQHDVLHRTFQRVLGVSQQHSHRAQTWTTLELLVEVYHVGVGRMAGQGA